MKKIMFSALACVAFAFSGFASNEVVEGNESVSDFNLETEINESDFNIEGTKPCEYYISITSPEGVIIDFKMYFSDLKPGPCSESFKTEFEHIKRLYPTMIVEGGITSF
ncbi:hypothetical protein [Flavobacterium sp. I3-2]|uniref:hypothetical protein n=1 Tax=Flavobacterium sp. I3-2 TaxID=2748319 RepID=UPI0015B1282D|nr:hypothetical protein [Flavobacterium sp. I3-2]